VGTPRKLKGDHRAACSLFHDGYRPGAYLRYPDVAVESQRGGNPSLAAAMRGCTYFSIIFVVADQLARKVMVREPPLRHAR